MWRANIKTGDYHDNMNSENYVRWLNEKLIPNLSNREVVVIDNAPYHNTQVDKCPSTKAEMEAWLLQKDIPFSPSTLKVELYELIKLHKPSHIRHLIDDIFKKHGQDILKLPPYHPELNAIEYIWADVKNWVAAHNVTFNIHDIESLIRQKFESITEADWIKTCEHIKKEEQDFIRNEVILEDTIESFVINLGAESSEEEVSNITEDEDNEGKLSGVEDLGD